jgi:hypothetical protein
MILKRDFEYLQELNRAKTNVRVCLINSLANYTRPSAIHNYKVRVIILKRSMSIVMPGRQIKSLKIRLPLEKRIANLSEALPTTSEDISRYPALNSTSIEIKGEEGRERGSEHRAQETEG